MSLRLYVRPRMVVLKPSASALESARAIESNNIGAVVIQDEGRVAGIVTDRDLAVRVVGKGRDPKTTRLAEVMSSPVVTLSPSDSQTAAIHLMQTREIRRIPLVEDERIVGIVTLDDLFLDEAASLDELSAVVQAQIGEGGPAPPPRSPAQRRRAARAEATYARLLNHLKESAALQSREEAETALVVVLSSLARRLNPDEAEDLIAQLPSLLQAKLKHVPPGPDKRITRETIEAELVERLRVDPPRARELLTAVANTIAESVSAGELEDVLRQLPRELRAIFPSPPSAAAP